MKQAYIVTVNYRSEDALNCLISSIKELEFDTKKLKLLIIDSSGELDIQKFNNHSNLEIDLIKTPHNRGFAYAANIGLKQTYNWNLHNGEKIPTLLLNPDVCLDKKCISELIKHQDNNTILGCAVTNEGFRSNSTIWGAGGSITNDLKVDMMFHNQKVETIPKTPYECDYIPGCSMLIPFAVIDKYKTYLPEEYFLYFEETDWCLNLRSKGCKLKIIPSSLVEHKSKPGKMQEAFRVYFYNRSDYLFKLRNLNASDKIRFIFGLTTSLPKISLTYLKEKDPKMKKIFKAHLKAKFDSIRIYFSKKNLTSYGLSKKTLKEFL